VTGEGVLSALRSRLAEAAIRHALGLDYSLDELPSGVRRIAADAVRSVAARLVEDGGASLRCGLCGRGPFTRRGLYLHLKRVHSAAIEAMIGEEVSHRLWSLRYADVLVEAAGSGGVEHAH